MPDDILEKFLSAPPEQRLEMARAEANAAALKAYFGEAAFAE